MKRLISLFILLFSLGKLQAQTGETGFKWDLSVRYRFESWNGMNAKNYGDNGPAAIGKLNDNTLYQRIITGFTYHPTAKLTFALHLQDSRAFGWSLRNNLYPDLFKIRATGTQSPNYTMNPNEEFFEIYDGFLEYKELLRNVTVKLGRQKIFFGDNHIFGPGDWGNTGRWTWDALRVSYQNNNNSLDLFAGGTITHDPLKLSVPFTQTEFWGGGAYGHFKLKKWAAVEPFYVLKTQGSADYINTQQINRQWLGTRIFNNDFHHFVFDLTAVQEFGSENSKNINAYGYFVKAGYQFHSLPAKPILSLRESYASGGKKSDGTIHTFDPAYGAGDKYYGWMNLTTWSNLDDREVVLELFPVKDMWIEMKYNRFLTPVPDDVKLLNTMKLQTGKNHLGDEFDLFIRYQVQKHWQITGAIGQFMPGDLMPVNNQTPEKATWFAMQVLFTI